MPKSSVREKPSMPRAVVDTNLFVRGLLKGPVTALLMQAWKEQRFKLVTSEKLIAELFEVLARPKFERHFTRDDVRELDELFPVMPLQAQVRLGALWVFQSAGDNASCEQRGVKHEKSNADHI